MKFKFYNTLNINYKKIKLMNNPSIYLYNMENSIDNFRNFGALF